MTLRKSKGSMLLSADSPFFKALAEGDFGKKKDSTVHIVHSQNLNVKIKGNAEEIANEFSKT